MKNYIFGVDVGGTTVKHGLFHESGELLEKWEIPTRTQDNGSHILSDIAEALEQKCAQRGIVKKQLLGVGLGVPGPVTVDSVVLKCVNLGWDVLNVEQELSKLTGLPTRASNDANAAALGEYWQGGGKGYSDIMLVTLGTGIGGGIIHNGQIVTGAHGAAGEIGHMLVNEDEPELCKCGKRGCLEQYASATGVARLMRRRLEKDQTEACMLKLSGSFTAKNVFDAAKAGDAAALSVIREAGSILGKGLAAAACVVDPQAIVIGGGMSRAGELLLQPVRESYARYVFHAGKSVEFVLAKLGNDAGMYGAARLVLR